MSVHTFVCSYFCLFRSILLSVHTFAVYTFFIGVFSSGRVWYLGLRSRRTCGGLCVARGPDRNRDALLCMRVTFAREASDSGSGSKPSACCT